MKNNIFFFACLFLSLTIKSQNTSLLVCYKILDKTHRPEISNRFNDIKREYYLYTIQGHEKAINFYTVKKITNQENIEELLKKRGFVFLNIKSEYKIIYDPSLSEEWRKEPLRKFTSLSGISKSQKILDYQCNSEILLDDISDTLEIFSTAKLPSESSLLFFRKDQSAVIKISTKDYEIFPEDILKIKFSFALIENFIPPGLKININPYQFRFEKGSEFPEKDRQINFFSVWHDNYPFFDLKEIKNYRKTIIFFSRGFEKEDTADSRKAQLIENYIEETKENIDVIAKEAYDSDSIKVIFITDADRENIGSGIYSDILKKHTQIKVIASAADVFKFYQINATPELFIIDKNGILLDIYSSHFMSDNLTVEEFIKNK